MSHKKNSRACPRYRKEHAMGFAKFLPASSDLKGSVSVRDLGVGAALGLGGSIGLKWAVGKAGIAGQLPAFVNKFWPAVSGITTGLILYAAEQKRSYAKAKAHLIGASMAGITISAWDAIKAKYPQLADLVSLQLSGYRGMLVDDTAGRQLNGYGGMLVDDNTASARNLAQLNGINMSSYGDDDMNGNEYDAV